MQTNILSLLEIQNYVKDKNVLLVGNSIAGLQKEQGDLIDSYDIVVRFGKGITDNKELYIGSKTDIWCTGGFRTTMRKHFGEDIPVLFNIGSKIRGGIQPPDFKHHIMYDEDQLDDINRKYGQKGLKRLSTGAVAAYFFVDKVKTYKSLTFINFDGFRILTEFYSGPTGRNELAGSWHLPIPLQNSYDASKKGTDHPAHDVEVEKALIEDMCTRDNVHFIGEMPETPRIIEIENASWDQHRMKIQGN